MSETKIIDAVQKVAAPDLTQSGYGKNLKQQFENIDYNFRKLGNYDFIKGEKGSDLNLEKISIFEEGGTILSDLGKAVVSTILGVEVGEGDTDIKSIGPDEVIGGSHWYDFFVEEEKSNADTSNISVFYREVNQLLKDSTKEYIGSPTPVVFIDARFSSNTINRVRESGSYDIYNDATDLSCALYVKYDGRWKVERINQFPTLYYQDSMFKWKISDQESGIKAQGVPGVDGRPGTTWIGFTKDTVEINSEVKNLENVSACEVNILCIQDEVGGIHPDPNKSSEDPVELAAEFEEIGVREGDSIIIIPRGDITDIDKGSTPKVDNNLIFFSTVKIKKTDKGDVYVAYYNRYSLINVSVGDAWIYDTLMRIGGAQNNKNYPIPGLFLRMNPDTKDDKRAHVLLAAKSDSFSSTGVKDHLIIRPSNNFENPSGSGVTGCSMSIKDYKNIELSTKEGSRSIGIELDGGKSLLTVKAEDNEVPNIELKNGFSIYSNYSESSNANVASLYTDGGVEQLTINRLTEFNRNIKVSNTIKMLPSSIGDEETSSISFKRLGDMGSGDASINYHYISSGSVGVIEIQADETEVSNDLTVGGKSTVNGIITANNKIQVKDCIEVYGTKLQPIPYIDFHYEGDTKDFTSRIAEEQSGVLTISGNLNVANTISTNAFQALSSSKCKVISDPELNDITVDDFFNRAWINNNDPIYNTIKFKQISYDVKVETDTFNTQSSNIKLSSSNDIDIQFSYRNTIKVSAGSRVGYVSLNNIYAELYLKVDTKLYKLAKSNVEDRWMDQTDTTTGHTNTYQHTFNFTIKTSELNETLNNISINKKANCYIQCFADEYIYATGKNIEYNPEYSITITRDSSITVVQNVANNTKYTDPKLILEGSVMCLGANRHRGIGLWIDTRSDYECATTYSGTIPIYPDNNKVVARRKSNIDAGLLLFYRDNNDNDAKKMITINDILTMFKTDDKTDE